MNKLEKGLLIGGFVLMNSALVSTFSNKTKKYILPLVFGGITFTTAGLSNCVYKEFTGKDTYQTKSKDYSIKE